MYPHPIVDRHYAELVVAPCPAAVLRDLLTERKQLNRVRSNLRSLVVFSRNIRADTETAVPSERLLDPLLLGRNIFSQLLFYSTPSVRCRLYLATLLHYMSEVFRAGCIDKQDEAYLTAVLENDVDEVQKRLELVQAADAVSVVEVHVSLYIFHSRCSLSHTHTHTES